MGLGPRGRKKRNHRVFFKKNLRQHMHLTGPPEENGMDYPRNLREFDRLFAPTDACLRFLEKVRWGDGFRCHSCGGRPLP